MADPKKKTIELVLQGGGAHGAFTWGVLDRLFEDGRVTVEGISGTSAGAMNGAVVAALPAFGLVREAVLGIGGDNPLISLAVAVNVLAGMTGSASGGMSIALDTLGETYVALANDAGIPLDLMHRVTSVATGGLDTLPHNGAVITLLAITGLTHREAYKDIFVVGLLIPIAALLLLIVLGTLFGSL